MADFNSLLFFSEMCNQIYLFVLTTQNTCSKISLKHIDYLKNVCQF